MYLSKKELLHFNEYICSLYVPQTEEQLRETIVNGLFDLIPGDNIAASAFDPTTLRISSGVSIHPFLSSHFYDAIVEFLPDHPLVHTLQASPILGGSVLSDYATGARWRRTATFGEVFGPENLNDQLSIEIARSSIHLQPTGIAVFRNKIGYSSKDRYFMRLVHPHIKQAFDNMSQGDISAILGALEGKLPEVTGNGLILLDEQKHVIHCSEETRQVLAQFFPGGIDVSGRLPLKIEKLLNPFSPRHYTETVGTETLQIRIYQDVQGRHLLVARTRGPQAFMRQAVALGLSRREKEVLYWLAQGKRNEEIAIILGLSFFTVKNHLKRIFVVLGVESRSAALTAAMPYL